MTKHALSASDFYNLACVFAESVAVAMSDEKLSGPARGAAADQYAAKGLELLRRAAGTGFFREGSNFDNLQADSDFELLRARADFQGLVRKLDAARQEY
ncbi:MAG TPA: hypothetical protein VKU82_05700 [Planctomycetaceae bacterium]|nr:hypothetical protein [Planctomycetaceae bacterium]